MSAFKIPHTDEVAFAPYVAQTYNMYDLPETVQLIDKWNGPLIPKGAQVVGKDVVLGWVFSHHKPVKAVIDNYINRIVNVEMVINTNLQVHKMPFVVAITPEDKAKAQDLIDRVLNDEVAVFMDAEDLNLIKQLTTATPYIIDKLYAYKTALENEILTMLGVDNATIDTSQDRQLLDAINANNAIITLNQEGMLNNLRNFCESIRETLGVEVKVWPVVVPVNSVHEEINDVGHERHEVNKDEN